MEPPPRSVKPPAASTSFRPSHNVPLLSLAPRALALGDQLTLGEPGNVTNVGGIWNVITRAADLVKDGQRLENLAWRHWGQPRNVERPSDRRASMSSAGSASTTSFIHTPATEGSSYFSTSRKPVEKRSFGGALKLLLEEDSNFRDWIEDAKRQVPVPTLSVPDTPVANLEIRLVEPTPVPSRVGSLGASMAAGGLLSAAAVPARLTEEDEEDAEEVVATEEPITIDTKAKSRSPKRRGKFFVHSSPSKGGSGSESSHPSPVAPIEKVTPPVPQQHRPHRKSSGSSHDPTIPKKARAREIADTDRLPRRNVSLSTMRGKFQVEKRRIAEALAAKDEDSGWEDEVEEWEEPADGEPAEEDGDWSDEADSPEKVKAARKSSSNLNLAAQGLRRSNSRRASGNKQTPPPPAPTPLTKMSKKERQAAAAERARIEAELEAQRKREMFAKQQIFGKAPVAMTGLLTGMFKSGGSMVDLTQRPASAVHPDIRPSPTHGHLPSLSQSPAFAPNLLRSKSAVAMPVQTGVSIIVSPQGKLKAGKARAGSESSKGSLKKGKPEDVELETDESDEEDNTLASSTTERKLAERAAKERARSQPLPAAQPVAVRFGEVAQPISPTTRRRAIIMREMSESLRRNLILEREKSSGAAARRQSQPSRPPPSMHSSPNLHTTQTNHNTELSPPDPQPRRAQTNILGAGFLRPLTRTGPPGVGGEHPMTRAQSSADLMGSNGGSASRHNGHPEAIGMARSSTDGEGGARAAEREARRREMARRSPAMDYGYRTHGW